MTELQNRISASEEIRQLDGIEILVDWAKSGKIDPWNVDIVQITDMFLGKLLEIKENNLRLTGRTLFFAAVLLKLKSNFLEGIDPFVNTDDQLVDTTTDNDFIEEADIPEDIRNNSRVFLEDVIERRTSIRKNRTRTVTLEDLLKQLRKLEEIENKQRRRVVEEQIRSRRSYTHFTPDDILEMAHEEYIEDEIDTLHNTLLRLFQTDEKIELQDLINTGMDKVNAYIALLFLSSRGGIDLVQENFYSDLYIVKEVC
jgi:segregation and condensation protein A